MIKAVQHIQADEVTKQKKKKLSNITHLFVHAQAPLLRALHKEVPKAQICRNPFSVFGLKDEVVQSAILLCIIRVDTPVTSAYSNQEYRTGRTFVGGP